MSVALVENDFQLVVKMLFELFMGRAILSKKILPEDCKSNKPQCLSSFFPSGGCLQVQGIFWMGSIRPCVYE